jgi:predicted HicB family RNase H-like nuclease
MPQPSGVTPIGRPPLAAQVSQLPATRVPAAVHDAVIREALQRDVSVAAVVREAITAHLHTRGTRPATRTDR